MPKLLKSLKWLDEHVLLILTAFIFAFIPLFPKLPLFDALPGYIVRVRVEDFLVLSTAFVWFMQVVRKKAPLQKSLLVAVALYAIVGFVSVTAGVLLLQTIPAQLLHIGKSALHYVRYLEYFALLFFAHSAVKTKKDLKTFLVVLAVTVLLASLYGFGQKYLHWPLYSTMNREYSKGEALYLSEFARIQSTFAGHYDLTAYLVLVLPILFATALRVKQVWPRFLLHFSHLIGIWLLLAGASKSSLAAYGITMAIVLLVTYRKYLTNFRGLLRIAAVGSGLATLGMIGLLLLAPDVYKSLAQLTKNVAPVYTVVLKIDSLLPDDSALKLQQQNVSETGNLKPDDVYVDIPDLVKVATTSATGETVYIIVEKERTWSENALKYGLSLGIRFDTLWPQALRGLVRNPLTGSAYATLNKEKTAQYTEADSTDNNFLRVLGETGILGFITFFGVLFFVVKRAQKAYQVEDPILSGLALGFLAGTVGILINAITIDVFAASKVAFTYWALGGLIIGGLRTSNPTKSKELDNQFIQKITSFFTKGWPLLVTLLVYFILVHQNPFTEQSPILNFSKSLISAEQITSARCFMQQGTFNLCRDGQTQLNGFNLYPVLLVPLLWIYDNPGMFYYLNLLLGSMSVVALWMLIAKTTPNRTIQFATLLLATMAVPFREMVPVAGFSYVFEAIIIFIVCLLFAWSLNLIHAEYPVHIRKIVKLLNIALLFSIFTNQSILKSVTTNFADQHTNWNYPFLRRLNTFFYNYTVGNTFDESGKKPIFLTTLNPYFIDLYSNGLYSVAPLSADQSYYDTATTVWSADSLTAFDQVKNGSMPSQRTFVTNFGLEQANQSAFQQVHSQFDLTVEDTACGATCNIYELHPNTKKISATPITWHQHLDLKTLAENYQFSVASQTFGHPDAGLSMGTKNVATLLKRMTPEQNFSVIMGDVLPNYDSGQQALLSQLILSELNQPLIYLPGNEHQHISQRPSIPQQAFFTEEELFVFLRPQADGSFSHDQQLFILNTLLDIDKIPTLKSVFVFTNQAAWVGANANSDFQNLTSQLTSNSPQKGNAFFLRTVIPYFQAKTWLSVFVVSGDMFPTSQMPTFSTIDKNIHYLSTSVSGSDNDHYLQFAKQNDTWNYAFVPVHIFE